MSPLVEFHPAVARWFGRAFAAPTPPQAAAWPHIRAGRHTLVAAPTGSGKTLTAFLAVLDGLVRQGLRPEGLPDETVVVYVSPLKALSNDIRINLEAPLAGIRGELAALGLPDVDIRTAVRTGDTPGHERQKALRRPPHILVTTPESLYVLLGSPRSRAMLATVRAVIVDEIHAVAASKRGSHLALSLERLEALTAEHARSRGERPRLPRIGLSATQKPIDEIARFLVGAGAVKGGAADCAIVDVGHVRERDLALEVPPTPLQAVLSGDQWDQLVARIAELALMHRTTLVFVNTRRMAVRAARHLAERLGKDAVAAHHGSLAKETRLAAEQRLKRGELRLLVATASLELGIDIGDVDLVCQLGSPRSIAAFLQRAGRAGHSVGGIAKARLFAQTRDELVECAALLDCVRRGELDALRVPRAPLDVLAQQIVAGTACRECDEDALYALVRRAWPYAELERATFDAVVRMLADGFATRNGGRRAHVHRDAVHRKLREKRGARMTALTSGGTIPESGDYAVLLEPQATTIGTVNEDFAVESLRGDVFQLGNTSYRILRIEPGRVRVEDAEGAAPNIPFWLGEAPGRSDELSRGVARLRDEVSARIAGGGAAAARTWLVDEVGIGADAATQLVEHLGRALAALGALPTDRRIVVERFFDESGGMQLVLHAPFGSRINKAWGLALRKRFCRQFNFELQAAATEDALLLSLGPQHSFPLADVFRYLHPATAKQVLIQALLDAPVFQTRWRWNTTISLAVPRFRGGRKVPPQLQRMHADDLMASVFPDAAACGENIVGDRQVPDHPLVAQVVRDCLEEAMDFPGLARVLCGIHAGDLRLVTRDTPEPSPFAHEILNARPYAFLDDAPLEERRTHAVSTRRSTDPSTSGDLGALDANAIARVRDEARPDPRDADELHDALVVAGFVPVEETHAFPTELFDQLSRAGRAATVQSGRLAGWVAAERVPEWLAVHPESSFEPAIVAPASRTARVWSREKAIVELVRGRLGIVGPTTAAALAAAIGIQLTDADTALLDLESQGIVLRGHFTTRAEPEWCDRRLLARIHGYTLNRLRAEIEPVSVADFMRFLFAWQHVHPAHHVAGADGLRASVAQLDGFELPASAWERAVLPARLARYEPPMLDMLCLTGQVGWGRLSTVAPSAGARHPMRVALFLRDHGDAWQTLRFADQAHRDSVELLLTDVERRVLTTLRARGACFLRDLAATCRLDEITLAGVMVTLAVNGLVTSDGFAGVRAVARASRQQPVAFDHRHDQAGRWSATPATDIAARDAAVELQAWALLNRYGVVFRRLLARETNAATWRELTSVYRRLEARGEIRGGRFVAGMSGEQFASRDAVDRLREIRRSGRDGRLVTISAADPLNLFGTLTSDDRMRAVTANRVVYRDGIALAVLEGDYLRSLTDIEAGAAADVASALAGRRVPAVTSGFIGRS